MLMKEPGTFKDRVILEGNPLHDRGHVDCGHACGADEGFYRGEYIDALEKPTPHAVNNGVLGKNISTPASTSTFMSTQGWAYICGEETALLASIEGKRGEPRSKPPYPTTNGLWGNQH